MKTTGSSLNRQSKWRTCFIAAPSRVNLKTIKTLLEDRGIRPLVSSALEPISGSLLEHVTGTISRADFLIAILDPKQSNANVYFELGYAQARGKRHIILASPELGSIPSDITGLLCVRANPENREAISFALDQLIAAPKQTKQKSSQPIEVSKPIGQLAEHLENKLKSLGDRAKERDVEEIVLSALQASGISVVASSAKRESGADIAIWADELEPWVGNPFLIEIKKHLGNKAQLNKVLQQVSTYLQKSNSRWALVLYLKASPLVVDSLAFTQHAHVSHIIFLGIHELLNRLKTTGFGEVVRNLRNRQVHGEGF